jgi:hypothetical protein
MGGASGDDARDMFTKLLSDRQPMKLTVELFFSFQPRLSVASVPKLSGFNTLISVHLKINRGINSN